MANLTEAWYIMASLAAVVLVAGVFHPRTRVGALAILTIALAFAGFGYLFAAPKHDELRTGCIFFTYAAILVPIALAADYWWWGLIGKLLWGGKK